MSTHHGNFNVSNSKPVTNVDVEKCDCELIPVSCMCAKLH